MPKPASPKYDHLRAMREAAYLAAQRRLSQDRKAEKSSKADRLAAKVKARKKR